MKYKLKKKTFEEWLIAYGYAWELGDTTAIDALFSATALYYETPFTEPRKGTEAISQYWSEGAGKSQRNIQFKFDILDIIGNMGIAHWKAIFARVPSEIKVELDGILTAEFEKHGACYIFREWWHSRES